ncbi:MAG: hypothetical protein DRP45_07070 [Candidatus Zixiibacteriota bacterium]|nr:MAG: hypothetical protein DRP45_07070 [candidate division Zixibacteria bacterium]
MKLNFSTGFALGVAVLAAVALTGCSSDSGAENSGFVARVVDTVAVAVAESLDNAAVTGATEDRKDLVGPPEQNTPAVDLAARVRDAGCDLPVVADMTAKGSLLYAVYDGGLLIYDLKTKDYTLTPVEEPLNVLVEHSGEIYAGGDCLYRIDGAGLVPEEAEFSGNINALASFGPSLMIGTTDGLFAKNILGLIALMEEVDVSALVSDETGLWVGTDGQGLFRWNGENFNKRYLSRDKSLFDHVTALAFNHDHLYLGTFDGLYVYDGGSWKTLTIDDGLPCAYVSSIDASEWVVYIGTTEGLVSYHNEELVPVKKLGDKMIVSVCATGRRIIAATALDGLILKSGPAVTTLAEPWQEKDHELAATVQ